jgi:hypothetical protein
VRRRLRSLIEAVRALPARPGALELALYLVAAALYIALGVAYPSLLLSWFEGTAFLLLVVWIIPALVRRLLR